MNHDARLRKIEAALQPAACPTCTGRSRLVMLHTGDPTPEPERCADCGKPYDRTLLVIERVAGGSPAVA